jgi:hypothetical protein
LAHFHRNRKKNHKTWTYPRPGTYKGILNKKNKVGNLIATDFKVYYGTTVINIAWYWDKSDKKANGTD